METVKQRRGLVNDAIGEKLPIKHPERLYEASRYLLDAGGKRLRPTVFLLMAEALTETEPLSEPYDSFGENGIDLMSAAVSVEIIQSFTLIHDDIMDDDDLRRGVKSVHRAFDEDTAILAGDTLYSKAFECMLETNVTPSRSVQALEELATTCTEICEGQALDVEFERRSDVSIPEYMEMVELKTAVLYAASAAIPAILLGADQETVDSLHGYGLDIGKAFQIQDDLLDLTVPSETLGKQRGSDLIEGKRTLITLHAREQGIDTASLVTAESVDEVSESEIDGAVEQLEEAGSIEYARETARDLITSGKNRLDLLPDSEARSVLKDIADYLIERKY